MSLIKSRTLTAPRRAGNLLDSDESTLRKVSEPELQV